MQKTEDKPSILVVDDNANKRLAIASVVADLGNTIQVASGREALKLILKQDFAVILLDVNMPEMDGFETAELIRKRKQSENTPIIFITAYRQTEDSARKGYSLGAVDYIYAPVVPDILRAKVKVFVDLFQMNQAMQRHVEELDAVNNELARNLDKIERLNTSTREMNRELESFSYSVSHDLRAPLRAIDGFSHILAQKYEAVLDDQGKDYLSRIMAAAQRMGQLIDDLLEFSRTGRADIIKQKVNLSEMARQIVRELKERDPDREVEFVVADGMIADGDVNLLRVVIENLMGNAFKYTGKKLHARIEIFGEKSSSSQEFICCVRDNGCGFDMNQCERLFGVFQRLHTLSEFPGTGIGLALVKRIIHRHGGRVWAEGTVGEGAAFYFSLPREGVT